MYDIEYEMAAIVINSEKEKETYYNLINKFTQKLDKLCYNKTKKCIFDKLNTLDYWTMKDGYTVVRREKNKKFKDYLLNCRWDKSWKMR